MQSVRMVLVLLSLALAAGVAVGVAQENAAEVAGEEAEICIPLGIIELQPPEGFDQQRTSVEFPHTDHILFDEFSCARCHHEWEGEEEIQSCTAAECHELTTKPPWGERKASHRYLDYTEDALYYFEFAYHKQCLGCHREYREAAEKKEAELEKTKEQEVAQANEKEAEGEEAEEIVKPPMGCWKCHPSE